MAQNMTLITQAIILAAGLGTRLKPLTDTIPKPALVVGGVPILYYNLALLKKYGVRDVVINLHHLPDVIKNLLAQQPVAGLNIKFSLEPTLLGTGGGILQAHRYLPNLVDNFYVLNGDILSDIDLDCVGAIRRAHCIWGGSAADPANHHLPDPNTSLASLAVISPESYPIVNNFVEYDDKKQIHRIANLPVGAGFPRPLIAGSSIAGGEPPPLRRGIFSGTSIINPKLFNYFPADKKIGCLIRDMIIPAIVAGEKFTAYEHTGYWCDVGDHEYLKKTDASINDSTIAPSILELKKLLNGF